MNSYRPTAAEELRRSPPPLTEDQRDAIIRRVMAEEIERAIEALKARLAEEEPSDVP